MLSCFRFDHCLDHVTRSNNIPNMNVLFIMLTLRRKFVKFQQIRTQFDVMFNSQSLPYMYQICFKKTPNDHVFHNWFKLARLF